MKSVSTEFSMHGFVSMMELFTAGGGPGCKCEENTKGDLLAKSWDTYL